MIDKTIMFLISLGIFLVVILGILYSRIDLWSFIMVVATMVATIAMMLLWKS